MLKRFFALFVAMLMLAGLCVPTFACDPDADDCCTCDEPWPENPECCGEWHLLSSGSRVHVFAKYNVYQCSQCGLYYCDYNDIADTMSEEHSGYVVDSYVDLEAGTVTYYCVCDICGHSFSFTLSN